jgi:NAD(P)-dependent dehydrogenase (short-subunit alcohol dehydrogenase family)
MSAGFDGKKVIVIGGSAGMGRQTAIDVVSAGGSAVIVGRDSHRVADTVFTLSATGKAYGLTAELTDRSAVAVLHSSWPTNTPMPRYWLTPQASSFPVPSWITTRHSTTLTCL